jgi:hypothetical protein
LKVLELTERGASRQVVAALAKRCIGLDVARRGGFTPLYVACQHGHTEVVRYLTKGWAHGLTAAGDPVDGSAEEEVGCGRMVALYYRSSKSDQIL